MTFFYRTSAKNAESILKEGFRDASDSNMLQGATLTGVWVSDRPMDMNEGTTGDTVLEIRLGVSKEILDRYDIREGGKPYHREWRFPSALLTMSGMIMIADGDGR